MNFWTIFGGSPFLYQRFRSEIFDKLDKNAKDTIAGGEEIPKDILLKCIEEAIYADINSGISAEVAQQIPDTGTQRRHISKQHQQAVTQLITRNTLKEIPYFAQRKETRIVWV